ncbi:DNA repair protein RAD51 homolog 4 isoform X1 [Gavia stellata]|uniref:DNA repair protein RAD51 homolog 4 isoform X1 n=1 Tax=Gavia stellata TaxID=37040 RepID=UPI00289C639E|nr:DNA repair protein RAD51 homolog 4 isoform X1 [Gavia stellata]
MVVLRAGLCPGLTQEMIQLLRVNGIRTVIDFVSSDLEDVAQKCSLSYKALVAVRRVLLAQFSAFPANGADLYEELKSSTAILPTGSPSLDQLLDSGLYTGEVTELMGVPGSGKTQVCLGIAASVSLSLKQHVLFLDSTGGFTASRLYQMLRARAENEEEQLEALQRIQVVRVFDIYEMLSALQELRDRLSQQVVSSMGSLKIVVIDSVSAVIYPLLGGKQSEGLAIMMQLARELKTVAREFSLAVVVSVAVPCPSRAAVCHGEEPCRASASLQPVDVLFQQVWSKNRADLLPAFIAVLSQHGIHSIEQGRVKYGQMERLFVFIFDVTPFI